MRQLIKKEFYETPITTRRVVTMESSCMAASKDPVVTEGNVPVSISEQEGFGTEETHNSTMINTSWE